MKSENPWRSVRRARLSRRSLLRASARAGIGAVGIALVGCADEIPDAPQPVRSVQPEPEPQPEPPPAPPPPAPDPPAPRPTRRTTPEPPPSRVYRRLPEPVYQGREFEPNWPYGGNLSLWKPGTDLLEQNLADPHRSGNWLKQAIHSATLGRLMQIYDNIPSLTEPFWAPDTMSLPEIPEIERFVFSANRGARFWDQEPTPGGRLFTAHDARLSLQRLIDAVDSEGNPDPSFINTDQFRRTTDVEAVDDETLMIKTDGTGTYVYSVLVGNAFMTSTEAIDLLDRGETYLDDWRALSGTGSYYPFFVDEELRAVTLGCRPDGFLWEQRDSQNLPLMNSVSWVDSGAYSSEVDAFYGGDIDLCRVSRDHEILELQSQDEFIGFEVPSRVPFAISFNFNPDLADNPWNDRRVAYAFHLGLDRSDFGKRALRSDRYGDIYVTPSATESVCSYHPWAISEAEMIELPGFRSLHPEAQGIDLRDATLISDLLGAAGVDREFEFVVRVHEVLLDPQLYPGLVQWFEGPYATNLGVKVRVDPVPTDVLVDLWQGGQDVAIHLVGGAAATLNPADIWHDRLSPGGSKNFEHYDFAPVQELVERMRYTLDYEESHDLALEIQRALLGVHEDYGIDAMAATSVLGNMATYTFIQPWLYPPDRAFRVWGDEGGNWLKEVFVDPQYPGLPERSRRGY